MRRVDRPPANACLFVSIVAALAALSCDGRSSDNEVADGGAIREDSGDLDARGAVDDAGSSDAHSEGSTSDVLDVEPPPADAPCVTCDPIGGQYCGLISEVCSTRTLSCPLECTTPGFTCGGRGVPNLCGPGRDAGCRPLTCLQPASNYCGVVGDGCGGSIDCGSCEGGWVCGGGGLAGVCGAMEGHCSPVVCTTPAGSYCGVIGTGCGGIMDCGDCPNNEICGLVIPHACGPNPPFVVPPPAPVPPLPPAPPRPRVPEPPPPPPLP